MPMLTRDLIENLHAPALSHARPVRADLADVAVAVTLFRPQPAQVAALVEAFAGTVPALYAFDNGGIPIEAARVLDGAPGVRLLSLGRNVGLGTALNRMAEAALAAGYRYLLLLDQDGEPSLDLARGLRAAMARLGPLLTPPAIVGPAPKAVSGRKAPRYPARPGFPAMGALAPVEFLATSGSLLDLAAFRRVGPFREDYFIDGIDLEWCFRAWAAGYSCWLDRDTPMAQCVGAGVIRARFLPVAMPRQPLFRMATYLRNTVYGWRLPHVPGRWKRRQMLYLAAQAGLFWADSGYRPAVLARLARAALDGLSGRLGRPADAP